MVLRMVSVELKHACALASQVDLGSQFPWGRWTAQISGISPRVIHHMLNFYTAFDAIAESILLSCNVGDRLRPGRTTFITRTPLMHGSPCYHQAAACQREVLECPRGPLAADGQTGDGSAETAQGWCKESVIVFTAAAGR